MTTHAGHYAPSFDGQLTAKQRKVISLIEQGKTNYEIAQELGVSLEGAKYHVSEILAKLDVNSREDAVRAWREYNSTGARIRRTWAGMAAIPVFRLVLVAAATVPVMLVAVLIVVTRGSGPGDGSELPAAASTETVTATREASSTAAAIPTTPPASTSTVSGAPSSGTAVATLTPGGATPLPTSAATAAGTPGTVQTTALSVYFLRGEDVGPVLREVPATQAVARAAIEQLLAGPAAGEASTGLSSSIPAGTRLLSISISDGVATVDLSGEFDSGGGTLSMQARLAQVVYTLTQFPTVSSLIFRLDGQETTVFGGEGIIIPSPATRADFEDLTPAILLDSPAQGETVSSPVVLTGTANTFEATFRIAIYDAAGNIIADEFATATSGTGTRGTFEVSVPFDVAAAGPGVIRVYESSARDGSPVNIVDVYLEP